MGLMYVENMERPDLRSFAKLTQADLRGYGFAKIMPVVTVREKGGKIWVAPKTLTDATGTKNRANGTALSGTDIKTVEVAYSTDRFEGRGIIYESEMHGFADMNAACQAGACDAGRKVLNSFEADVAAKVFTTARTGAAVALADGSFIKGLQKAAKSVRAYGKAALYMTDEAFLKLCDVPEVRNKLELGAKATGDIAYLALNDEKVLATVSTLLGFHAIAIVDSGIVGTGYDDFIAVVAIRPEAFGATGDMVRSIAKSRAMYGALMVYVPEDAPADEPFVLSQSSDRKEKANYFDAEGFVQAKEFHTPTTGDNGGVSVVKFAAAAAAAAGAEG